MTHPRPAPAKAPRGAIAMITVMLIMAVILASGLVIAAVGRDETVLSGIYHDGELAFSIADACLEEGVNRFKLDGAFAGTTLSIDGGTCTVVVQNIGGNDRLVTSTGRYANSVRIVVANVTLTFNVAGNAKKIKINSWKESD